MNRTLRLWNMPLLIALIALAGQAQAQFVNPGGSPTENLRDRNASRPGIRVLQGIANHTNGPEITETQRPGPQFGPVLLDELLRNLFGQLNVFINLLPQIVRDATGGVGGGGGIGGGGATGVNDIVMTELSNDGNVSFVELVNRSPLRMSLAGWVFSDGNLVSPSLPPLEIERGVTIVVQFGGDTQSQNADFVLGFRLQNLPAGELALYDFSGVPDGLLPIENPDLMVDYIQWNDDIRDRNPPLEQIAAQANLWTTIDAIPFALTNRTFRLNPAAEARDSTSSTDFIVDEFAANTLGMTETP